EFGWGDEGVVCVGGCEEGADFGEHEEGMLLLGFKGWMVVVLLIKNILLMPLQGNLKLILFFFRNDKDYNYQMISGMHGDKKRRYFN
ncbi:MAG: hypothetical protein KAS32_00295, partial [Candidatus Peribacteraceae bacterium]|nr:hypothetical protein [Candidatus Peribacteraceae bacterium]